MRLLLRYGQLFIGAVMLLGVVFLAMPLSTVGNNFTSVWEERQVRMASDGFLMASDGF